MGNALLVSLIPIFANVARKCDANIAVGHEIECLGAEDPNRTNIVLSSDWVPREQSGSLRHFPNAQRSWRINRMKKYVLAATTVIAIAAPAMADDVGVHV